MSFYKEGEFLPEPGIPLYHYTDSTGLKAILEDGNLRASHIDFLNDSREFHHAFDMVAQCIAERLAKAVTEYDHEMLCAMQRTMKTMVPHTFVISFSEKRDVLSQWRGYCPNGGYNIEFRSRGFKSFSEFAIVPCIYNEVDQQKYVREMVEECLQDMPAWGKPEPQYEGHQPSLRACAEYFSEKAFWVRLQTLASAMKNSAFEEEAEWRLIGALRKHVLGDGFRAKGPLIIPYKNLNIRHDNCLDMTVSGITVGPMANMKLAKRGIDRLLEGKFKNTTCEVKESAIPYRTF